MQKHKNDIDNLAELMLEVALPKILTDAGFALVQDSCSKMDMSLADFIESSLAVVSIALASKDAIPNTFAAFF